MLRTVTVGIIQARPVYLDLKASMDTATSLIRQAARDGVELIAFGETWLPGYPAWLDHCPEAALWDHEPTKEVFAIVHNNSVVVPGKETATLSELARELNVVIVIGVNEKVEQGPGNGTIYNTLLTFDSMGELVNHHRKLMPTYTERLVWGHGDGSGLRAVGTSVGRVSGLICWEHWMPLARQALHESGEQVHVAAWPGVHDVHQLASRHYAFEGRCFVLAAGLLMTAGDIPPQLKLPQHLVGMPDQLIMKGGSAIIAPNGRYVVGPVFDDETILTARLSLGEIAMEHMTLDTTGHYARPDVFSFQVHRARPGATGD